MASGFNIRETQVSFKKLDENAFQFVGKDPIPEDACVPLIHLENPQNRLYLRCRYTGMP